MCDIGHTCGEDTTGNRDEFFIIRREPETDASCLRRDLARILLCDATTVVVIFSSLVAGRHHLGDRLAATNGCRRFDPLPPTGEVSPR
jgi:hypothetical protein